MDDLQYWILSQVKGEDLTNMFCAGICSWTS